MIDWVSVLQPGRIWNFASYISCPLLEIILLIVSAVDVAVAAIAVCSLGRAVYQNHNQQAHPQL